MAPHVFAQELHFTVQIAPRSRMGGAGELLKYLGVFQARFGAKQRLGYQANRMSHGVGYTAYLRQAVGSTQTAPGATCQIAATLAQPPGTGRRHLQVHFNPLLDFHHIDAIQLGGRCQQALGDAKTQGEIVKIARRRHHHGM